MKLLLDTSVLIWWLDASPRLPQAHLDLMRDPANTVFVSALSVAEIAIKVSVGKLSKRVDPMHFVIEDEGFTALPLTAADAELVAQLPLLHRDPFDRLLVAQAMANDLILLTVDPLIKAYDVRTI